MPQRLDEFSTVLALTIITALPFSKKKSLKRRIEELRQMGWGNQES